MVGSANDRYEREADHIASHIGAAQATISPISPRVQTQSGTGVTHVASSVQHGIGASSPGGEPLAQSMRASMESHLGADLGGVRVHRDGGAAAMNQAINARAFTYGSHIWLGAGESMSDQKLVAHELVHTVQQRGAGSAPAIQRAPKVAMQEWTLDHSDITDGNEVTELNVAVSYLGVNDTAAAFFGWIAEDRPQWATKKGLYVRAIDFLRDNRDLFDVPNIHETLNRVMDFCDQSSVTVSGLTDKFYEDLLVAAVYSAAPGSASFRHRSFGGEPHFVAGRKDTETDFAPTRDFGDALLRKDPKPVKQATGGAGTNAELLVEYGALPGTVVSKTALTLIDKYKGRMPKRLLPYLARVATDPMLNATLQRFFGDGGKFIFKDLKDGLAHYTPGKTPQIEVHEIVFPGSGSKHAKTEIGVRATIVHELLHYALDRADAFITERGVGGGGNDHPLIGIIQDRYMITETIRTGGSLLDESISALEGWVGKDHKPELREFIRTNDFNGLLKHVREADFIDDLTFTKAVSVVGKNTLVLAEEPGTNVTRADMMFDPSQITDIMYMCAINAVIIKRAFELAALYADEHEIELSKVFGHSGYIREIGEFIDEFIALAARKRNEGVKALALMTALN